MIEDEKPGSEFTNTNEYVISLHSSWSSSQCSTTGVPKAVVCGMVHIKEPLQLIGTSSPCGGSEFPLSLSEWSFT